MILLALAIASGPLLLLSWSLLYTEGCWVLVFPLAVIAVTALAARDSIRYRKQCLADSYFAHGSLLHQLMRSTTIISVGAIVVATFLTTLLLIRVPSWDLAVLILLALDSLLIASLYVGFSLAAPGVFKINQGYRSIFARNVAVVLNIPLLLVALMLIQLKQPPPEYLDPSMDLSTTLQSATTQLQSQCKLVDKLIRANLEVESFSWWLMIKSSASIDNRDLHWIAWMIFLLSGALGLLAYSRFCVQLVHYAYVFGNRL